jgi:hypothetical protein
MPIAAYDRYFGGNAAKAMRELVKRYGPQKGRSVFYATVNKRKKKS